MNSTMNLPYIPGYNSLLSGVGGGAGLRGDPRDMEYYIADGDPVGGTYILHSRRSEMMMMMCDGERCATSIQWVNLGQIYSSHEPPVWS